ncbi:MAG: hypothetical protein DSZ06_03785 [Sulfurospirillum sp.]|nr:MAG: hypothetical protein DSZ06_03785 [Sulfurospirillum sp.]
MAVGDIVVTLVFSIVLLGIMLFPSIKIADSIDKKRDISRRVYLLIAIGLDIALSIIGGIFLAYY